MQFRGNNSQIKEKIFIAREKSSKLEKVLNSRGKNFNLRKNSQLKRKFSTQEKISNLRENIGKGKNEK